MSILDLIDEDSMRCTICGASGAIGSCGCWARCRCGWWACTALGEQRANNLHVSKGCGNEKCSNRGEVRGCQATWWHRRDEGRLCVLPIGHKGRHRYTHVGAGRG